MSNKPLKQSFSLGRTLRRYFVSAFVVFTFIAYALHERSISSEEGANAAASMPASVPARQIQAAAPTLPTVTATPLPAAPSLARPTPTITPPPAQPTPTVTPPPPAFAVGQYKDGQYTGPQVDAYWGQVQVEAIVQKGQITDVRFLQYPNDRRTSQRINSIVMPYLQSEAIQAQNANVDLVSGATLTSEAFSESLQAALASARN